MSKCFVRLFHTLVLSTLILSVGFLTPGLTSGATTYDVPQKAEVKLAWDPNEPAPDGYCIYQRKEDESYDYSQPCWNGTNTTGTIYNLEWGTTYHFVVRAYDGGFESADSDEVQFTTPSSNDTIYYNYRHMFSSVPDRSSPSALDGATVQGPIYVFIDPITDIQSVKFYFDNVLRQTENYAPFDMAGGSIEIANPFDTNPLTDGLHTVDALITKADGSSETVSTKFYVGNAGSAVAKFVISPSAGEHGAISPGSAVTVDEDGSQTFSIAPDHGYHIVDVMVDGVSKGAISTYTFNQVSADHTIISLFGVDTYTITASSGTNGAISPAGSVSVNNGESKTYTITPNSGYHVTDVKINGVSVGAVPSFTFSNVRANHSIDAAFDVDTFAITATAGENGRISPSGTVEVPFGGRQTFTFQADSGFHISDVLVDGQSMGTIEAYTFTAIDASHTLEIIFAENSMVEIWLEAEDGDIQWPMEIADDQEASAGGFVWVTEGTGNLSSPSENAGYAEYTFEIPETGNYFIWGRTVSNDNSDSFFITVDGQESMIWHTKPGGQETWTWDFFAVGDASIPDYAANPTIIQLKAGVHKIKISQCEDGTKLDKLFITNNSDPSFYELMVSRNADRSEAALLSDSVLNKDDVYVFVDPVADVQRVEFLIDGGLHKTENKAPFDLAGGSAELANPFNTEMLSDGEHTISARISKTDGSFEIITAVVKVSNSAYKMLVSNTPDRLNPNGLSGRTLSEGIYVFVDPVTDIQRVEFLIDGGLHKTENKAPFDLAGGSAKLANSFDTGVLSQGSHTIAAMIIKNDGSIENINVEVIIDY